MKLTRLQLKEQGFFKCVLGGANVVPWDWLHENVFDRTIEIDRGSQEYDNEFIGILEDVNDNLICHVYWNEDKTTVTNYVIIKPLNNYPKGIKNLIERLEKLNDEPVDINYLYTLVEWHGEWGDVLKVTFWRKEL